MGKRMSEPMPARGTNVKRIRLSGGLRLVLDAKDFEQLPARKWYPLRHKDGRVYAISQDGLLMHRLILGCTADECADHINGNGLDNRRSNLRIATASQNSQNAKMHADNQVGYKGVFWAVRDGRWRAVIWIKGHGKLHIGAFDSKIEAARAYDEAAKKHFGQFAKLNFS